MPALEKAGFEHMDAKHFSLLIDNDTLYILNKKDFLVVKFTSNKPGRAYKEKGQGPGSFLNPRSMFFSNKQEPAIFDTIKKSIVFFDLDLNYKREIRVNTNFNDVIALKKGFAASGDFGNFLFATLDSQFKIIDTFVNVTTTVPFANLPPAALNCGYLSMGDQVAHTAWLFTSKTCKVNIIDANSKKKTVGLEWEQRHSPTQKDIDSRSNMYSSFYVGKHGKFYVVSNLFNKSISAPDVGDLLIFDSHGKLISRDDDFPYGIVKSFNTAGDSRVYFFDEERGLLFFDLSGLKK